MPAACGLIPAAFSQRHPQSQLSQLYIFYTDANRVNGVCGEGMGRGPRRAARKHGQDGTKPALGTYLAGQFDCKAPRSAAASPAARPGPRSFALSDSRAMFPTEAYRVFGRFRVTLTSAVHGIGMSRPLEPLTSRPAQRVHNANAGGFKSRPPSRLPATVTGSLPVPCPASRIPACPCAPGSPEAHPLTWRTDAIPRHTAVAWAGALAVTGNRS
jgi:hypothetical protein